MVYKRPLTSHLLLIFALLLMMSISLYAQEGEPDATPDLREVLDSMPPRNLEILDNINQWRLGQNLVPLVPNVTLNELAIRQVFDVASRPVDNLGNLAADSAGGALASWLVDTDFQPYSNGHFAEIGVFVSRRHDYTTVVSEIFTNDAQRGDAERIYRMLNSNTYREIGIGYTEAIQSGVFYYVIIVGAQPNVLPVVATYPRARYVIDTLSTSPEITIYVHNENYQPRGDGQAMGRVINLRAYEAWEEEEQECPSRLGGDWQSYRNVVDFELSAGLGMKTIYVQMCDETGRTTTSSLTINFVGTEVAFIETPTLPTDMPTETPMPPPTDTPITPTDMPTETPMPPPTDTPITPTDMPTETPMPPTNTPITPTDMPTETPVPPPTDTPVTPTDMPTETPVPPPTDTPVSPTPIPTTTLGTTNITAVWGNTIFVLITGDEPVNLSEISFRAGANRFGADDWRDVISNRMLSNVAPYSCLAVFSAFEIQMPDLPPGAVCGEDKVIARVTVHPDRMVWRQPEFDIYIGNERVGQCRGIQSRTTCNQIPVPVRP